jgi:5-methylcytosine-specific restriction protein A
MPAGAYRECRHPRCGNYATANGYCLEHRGEASARPGAERGLTPANKKFRGLRRSFLHRHPLCAGCKLEPATILDHITPHRGVPSLFWSQANWQGLCPTCHGRKTARELWGTGQPTRPGISTGPSVKIYGE